MKVNLIGTSRGHGISFKNDKNGVEYSMSEIRFLIKTDSYKSTKSDHTVEAIGFEQTIMSISDELFEKVKVLELPCQVELINEEYIYKGQFKNKLVEIKPIK